jgi:hypothetical protein
LLSQRKRKNRRKMMNVKKWTKLRMTVLKMRLQILLKRI